MQIEHLDGHSVRLEAGDVTRPRQVAIIKGEGMPVYDSVRAAGFRVLRRWLPPCCTWPPRVAISLI